MVVFGSSNWSQQSAHSQQEHNYFCNTKPWFFNWFLNQFQRRWNSPSEYTPFVPIGPGAPALKKPINAAVAQPLSLTLTWDGGPWGQRYDVYFGISSNPPLMASDVPTTSPTTMTETMLSFFLAHRLCCVSWLKRGGRFALINVAIDISECGSWAQ